MKPDTYTRVLLTIIAGCMLIMVVRTFENPDLAFAQTAQKAAAKPGAQHVIIDGISGSSLGGLPVSIESVSPLLSLRSGGLPVFFTDDLGRKAALHVIIDELDTRLSLTGMPVSLRGAPTVSSPQHVIVDSGPPPNPSVRWELDQSDCLPASYRKMAAEGWELVAVLFLGPGAPGPSYNWTGQQILTVAEKSCATYFKRPVR